MASAESANPLTGTVIVVLLSEAWTIKRWLIDHTQPDLFAGIAILHAAVLTFLYLRKSSFAGAFLLLSVAPIYPLYYFACQAGWYGQTLQPRVAVVMLVVWVFGILFIWREKQKYDRYIAQDEVNQYPASGRQ